MSVYVPFYYVYLYIQLYICTSIAHTTILEYSSFCCSSIVFIFVCELYPQRHDMSEINEYTETTTILMLILLINNDL